MADLVASSLKTYFLSLAATNAICAELIADRFTFGTNLFIGTEPETTNCITIFPYPAGPPSTEGDRHESGLQVKVKASSVYKSLRTSQWIINTLHNNSTICTGRFTAVQSTPILLGVQEGGEKVITVSNYIVKHIKL